MKITCVSIIFLLTRLTASGQDTHVISGRVVDAGGRSVQNVSIRLTGISGGTMTDAGGFLHIKHMGGATP